MTNPTGLPEINIEPPARGRGHGRGGRSTHSDAELLALHDQGFVAAEIARHYGVSRQAVSQRLSALGIHPRSTARAAREDARAEYLARRKAETRARREGIVLAYENLSAIADQWNVAPSSLSQWATKSGPYSVKRKPRRDARLPVHGSLVAQALVEQVYAVCAPHNPHYIGDGFAVRLARKNLDEET